MQYVAKDRIQMGSSSTGTGNLILNFQTNRKNFLNLPAIGANTPNNKVYYSISDGTNWEVGIGSFAGYANTIPTLAIAPILTREEVFESSNGNSFVDFSAAIKNVSLTLPANVTQGSVATADNSSIGTDLVAWNNLKKELNKRIVRSVPYDNRGICGIVSTYSLGNYNAAEFSNGSGAVLGLDGTIYFVPSKSRGGKISPSGVISTYSITTTSPDGSYNVPSHIGGVLAPNGNILFIRHNQSYSSESVVGRKINPSGAVGSNYSLVYTNSQGYAGGVLAPNGNTHFVPYAAAVGQKAEPTGSNIVTSTYSLLYSSPYGAYFGGILAPNGDIHFVPRNAPVGQKVSAAGVVSTYSLVYTISIAYQGGVLAPNGDIHFVPHNATVGQKISIAGVVSTYSLVYTTSGTFSDGAYSGGVLAPNGDIHFVPHSARVGQKISAAGVVSTYSLVYTVSQAYSGGILAPNGDIHFAPFYASVGQKIATGINLPLAHCASPFFNKL